MAEMQSSGRSELSERTKARHAARAERARRQRRYRLIILAALALILLCAAAGLWYGRSQRTHQGTAGSPAPTSSPAATVKQVVREALDFSEKQGQKTAAALPAAMQKTPQKALKKKEEPAPAQTGQSTSSATSALKSSNALSGKVIVIDPGHQARADTSPEPIGPGASETKPKVAGGTTGVVTHIPEGQTVLSIGLKLKAALEAQGAKVVMTRTSQDVNVSNSQRAAIANDAHADLFIRLHCDGSTNSSAHGISMLVPASNQWTAPIVASSRSAGETLQAAVIAATGAKNNGVVNRSDLSGFNYCKVPSVLIEMGFMTNANEDQLLNSASYQSKLVNGLTQGCLNWLK